MADSAQNGGSPARRRWPYLGRPQGLLLVAALVTMIASFLPWLDTALGSTNGAAVGGLYTFYAGLVAVPGAILRRRRVVIVHALVLAMVGIGVPTWRLLWALGRLPGLGQAWLPGVGLMLVLISGGVAGWVVVSLVRTQAADGRRSSVSPVDR
ncbi:MAG: hypothetical protein KY460_16300 [Actinobacteria bacterium]|nr:hypothetical protein [Actinomycetota bacterium]